MNDLERLADDEEVRDFFKKLDKAGVRDDFRRPYEQKIVRAKIMGTILDRSDEVDNDDQTFILKYQHGRERDWLCTINVCDLVAMARYGYKRLIEEAEEETGGFTVTQEVPDETIKDVIAGMNKDGYRLERKKITFKDVIDSDEFRDYLREYINNGGITSVRVGISDAIEHAFHEYGLTHKGKKVDAI
jgi:hypothetical protein